MTLTTVNAGMLDTQAQYTGFKNRLINGSMTVDQRNAGASVTPTGGQYLVDRFYYQGSQASKFTSQRNAAAITPPTGFSNYLGLTVSSSVSIGAGDYFFIAQAVEGFNISDLALGTASAKPVTLSFQVYSSLTGTFGGSLRNAMPNRSYPFTYSIPVANTWTTISITIIGDTSGTWTVDNSTGILVTFSLGVGSTYSGTSGAWAGTNYASATGAVSVVGTSGATFYITGVQLEKGSTATSFDYLDYGRSLIQCQRYYQAGNMKMGGYCSAVVGLNQNIMLPVVMRSSPTIVNSGQTNAGCTGSAVAAVDAASLNLSATGTSGPGYISASNYTAAAEL